MNRAIVLLTIVCAIAACGPSEDSCNGQCYDPSSYDCTTDYYTGALVLCPKNNRPCNNACYDPTMYHCRSGRLIEGPGCGDYAVTGLDECNNNQCYNATEYICTSDYNTGAYTLCPLRYSTCRSDCYDPEEYSCKDGELVQGKSISARVTGWNPNFCPQAEGTFYAQGDFNGSQSILSNAYQMTADFLYNPPCTIGVSLNNLTVGQNVTWKVVGVFSNRTMYYGCGTNETIYSINPSDVPLCSYVVPETGYIYMAMMLRTGFPIITQLRNISALYNGTNTTSATPLTPVAVDTSCLGPTSGNQLQNRTVILVAPYNRVLSAINGTITPVFNGSLSSNTSWRFIQSGVDSNSCATYSIENIQSYSFINSTAGLQASCEDDNCLWTVYYKDNTGGGYNFVNKATQQSLEDRFCFTVNNGGQGNLRYPLYTKDFTYTDGCQFYQIFDSE